MDVELDVLSDFQSSLNVKFSFVASAIEGRDAQGREKKLNCNQWM